MGPHPNLLSLSLLLRDRLPRLGPLVVQRHDYDDVRDLNSRSSYFQ